MLRTSLRYSALAACLLTALLACGCAKSAPTHFYSLTTGAGGGEAQAGPCFSLGVGPVDLPAYLDRTQIVSREAGNRMMLSEFDQWIEPMQANFTHALNDALARQACVKPLVTLPWPIGVKPKFQLTVQVKEFEGTMGKEAVLRADWSLLDADGVMLDWRSSTLREPVAGTDYPALVTAQSRLVDRLAAEVAAALKAQPSGEGKAEAKELKARKR